MEVFRANHGSLLRTLGDPDMQIMHRLLGSDSPLQGELLSYLLFDPDFFDAASELGRRDAQRWVEDHPDLWRTEGSPSPRADPRSVTEVELRTPYRTPRRRPRISSTSPGAPWTT